MSCQVCWCIGDATGHPAWAALWVLWVQHVAFAQQLRVVVVFE